MQHLTPSLCLHGPLYGQLHAMACATPAGAVLVMPAEAVLNVQAGAVFAVLVKTVLDLIHGAVLGLTVGHVPSP